MARLSDQVLAERMLKAREQGGYRFVSFLRTNARRYILLLAYFGALLAVLSWLELWPGVCVVIGLVIGACLRDLGWLIGVQRTWPFSLKVIDWEKVQTIAKGLPITEPSAPPNGGPAVQVGSSGVPEGPPSVS